LFSLMSLVGQQSVIWYQSADLENIGMFLLSLSLFFLAKSIYSKNKISFYKTAFAISLALCSLYKESFLLMVPAILFLYLWIYAFKNSLTIIESFKFNRYLISIFMIY